MRRLFQQDNYVMALFFEMQGNIVSHAFSTRSVLGEIEMKYHENFHTTTAPAG